MRRGNGVGHAGNAGKRILRLRRRIFRFKKEFMSIYDRLTVLTRSTKVGIWLAKNPFLTAEPVQAVLTAGQP